ncbi:MAG: HAD-IIA family hydrolase [Armatimonadetes bacterium]|nr:HAD-IIA family hydrolase [Armatimonadota bacterium]
MCFYSCYAFDLDGTLYRGNEVVPGAAETVAALQGRGARILYVTNNSGLTKGDYVEKLGRLGFSASEDQIVTSGQAGADVCRLRGYQKVFLVGEPGLVATFRANGLEVVNAGEDGSVRPSDSSADVVVSGICREALSYRLLDSAMQVAIQTQNYIACNGDLTYPIEGGKFSPGSGSIVAAIEACSGVKPFVAGKPNPTILTSAFDRLGIDAADTLMVGDRMDTDIACGRAAGCDTLLVLSGVAHEPVGGQWCLESVRGLL